MIASTWLFGLASLCSPAFSLLFSSVQDKRRELNLENEEIDKQIESIEAMMHSIFSG